DESPQVAREDVEPLEVGISEGQNLAEEGVETDIVGQLATEIGLLGLAQARESGMSRREDRVEPILGGLGIEVDRGERLDVRRREYAESQETGLEVVELVWIGAFRK